MAALENEIGAGGDEGAASEPLPAEDTLKGAGDDEPILGPPTWMKHGQSDHKSRVVGDNRESQS